MTFSSSFFHFSFFFDTTTTMTFFFFFYRNNYNDLVLTGRCNSHEDSLSGVGAIHAFWFQVIQVDEYYNEWLIKRLKPIAKVGAS